MSIDSDHSVLSLRRNRQGYDPLLDRESREIIAHGALTNSKRPETFVKGVYPTHLVRSRGCKVTDTMGNEYIDFICALGTNLVGYSNEKVRRTIESALQAGISFSLSTTVEITLGRLIKDMFPFVERMRFLKTGSEGCSAAVRIARAFTGRLDVLSQHYHGWHDEFVSLTPPANGVPAHHSIRVLSSLDQITHTIAAVIIEPIVTELTDERMAYLRALREKCTETGTVLIFDETITALRFPKLSASAHCGVTPDLIVFGKALGGGLPLSCVGGKSSIMDADYFVSSTFAGETLSLHAAIAVLSLLKHGGAYSIETLWSQGTQFQKKFNEITKGITQIEGYPTRGVFSKKEPKKLALFFQEAAKAGILFGPSFFLCFSHVPEFDSVLSAVKDISERINRGECELEGKMPETPFSQKTREVKNKYES